MYPANITRQEAAERSAQVSTHSYEVTVDLSGRVPDAGDFDPTATFVSTSTVRFSTIGGATYVNLIADRLLAASIDGEPAGRGRLRRPQGALLRRRRRARTGGVRAVPLQPHR